MFEFEWCFGLDFFFSNLQGTKKKIHDFTFCISKNILKYRKLQYMHNIEQEHVQRNELILRRNTNSK
jgi:hypothetical protein